jgi:hypothetical protein
LSQPLILSKTQIRKENSMKRYFLLFTILSLVFASSSMAMKGMEHGNSTEDGGFTHTAMAGDIHTEFKVMDLASMNMKDPDGKTHHVMATFTRDGEKISKVVGKIKLVSPSKKEQLADLKDYGGGVFAANFNIDEPGKWGVICLFKDEKGKQTVKFWYPHMAM